MIDLGFASVIPRHITCWFLTYTGANTTTLVNGVSDSVVAKIGWIMGPMG